MNPDPQIELVYQTARKYIGFSRRYTRGTVHWRPGHFATFT